MRTKFQFHPNSKYSLYYVNPTTGLVLRIRAPAIGAKTPDAYYSRREALVEACRTLQELIAGNPDANDLDKCEHLLWKYRDELNRGI